MNLKQIEERLDDTFGNQRTTPYDLFITKKIREKIKQFISAQITQLLEELREEELKRDFKTTIEDNWSAIGYNACAKSINYKINKIINK